MFERLRRGIKRAYRRRGFERDTAVIIIKCTIAATAAWVVGTLLGGTTQIGFAPFTALLVVRPSVYGSVLQSGRYVAAVFAGALFAALVGLTVGAQLWAFALMVLFAMAVGQVRLFGGQGIQIPVVAAFALAGGTAEDPMDIGYLLLMVCVGAVCALLTNVILAPTVRFRDAENAVLDFSDGLRSLTGEMAAGLGQGREGLDLNYWGRAAGGFDGTVRNAEEAVLRQQDRARLNPRRMLGAAQSTTEQLEIYRDWVSALSRASRHVQSLIRTLRTTNLSNSRFPAPEDGFLRDLSPLIQRVSDVFRMVHDQREPKGKAVSEDLRRMVGEGLSQIDEERERMRQVWDSERWPIYSALLTDVERLLEEIHQGYENTEATEVR